MGNRSKVNDRIDAVEERAPIEFGGDVRDRYLLQFRRSGVRRTRPPDRCADRVPARDEPTAKDRADKAGCTGHEDAHDECQGDAASLFFGARGILASLYLQAIRATTIRALSERKAERMAVSLYPVILSGGSGSRLWPMSRRLLPKQFLPLVSERSLLQDTVLRLRGLDGAGSPIVVSNDEHRFLVAEQMREIGVQPEVQILEP